MNFHGVVVKLAKHGRFKICYIRNNAGSNPANPIHEIHNQNIFSRLFSHRDMLHLEITMF